MKKILLLATLFIGVLTFSSSPPAFTQTKHETVGLFEPININEQYDVGCPFGINHSFVKHSPRKVVDVISLLPLADQPAARLAAMQEKAEEFYYWKNIRDNIWQDNLYRNAVFKVANEKKTKILNIPKRE